MADAERAGGAVGTAEVVGAARYRAFISYAHRDKASADWLHAALETFRVPAKLVGTTTPVGPVPRRLLPIFRDRDELSAAASLDTALVAALEASAFLVVICSPAAARSHWVAEEILAFKRAHGEGRVLALIVAGEPGSDDEPFPAPLRFRMGADGILSDVPAHPIAADIRPGKDGRQLGKLKLIAGLTGLRLDDLVRREAQRRMRRLRAVAIAASAGMALTGGLAVYANVQRVEAVHQRQVAVREAAASRAASDFLIGTFRLTNPATQNPRTVTALSILATGAQRVRTELADQPGIQARMLATVANAYNNLGLSRDAAALVEGTLPALRRAGPQGAPPMEQLAFSYIAIGRLDRARAMVDTAERQLGPDAGTEPEIRGRLERARALVLLGEGDARGGLRAIDRAIKLLRAAPGVPPRSIALALQTRGLLLNADARYADADVALRQSLAMFRRAVGDHDLLTGKAWQVLALNELAAGRLPAAENAIDHALAIERTVLSADNPLLADDLSTAGQILTAEHRPDAAAGQLSQAVAIYRRAYGRPNYQTGIVLVYLALAEGARGRTDAALADLVQARHEYDVSYGKLHPNHGDLLVNRATILAGAGRLAEARHDCAAGVSILDRTLGADAAFTKDNRAICAKIDARRESGPPAPDRTAA